VEINLGSQQLIMGKENVVYKHTMEYYSAIKKNKIKSSAGK
jgi:hypothetical protein